MSRTGLIERLFFGEGEFSFRLAIDQMQALEEIVARRLAAFGFSPGEASLEKLAQRLGGGGPLIFETKEVLRLGLVGAGMAREAAFDLVARNVVDGYLMEAARIAYAVVSAALVGVPEDTVGEPKGEGAKAAPRRRAKRSSPTAASAGVSSTARPRR